MVLGMLQRSRWPGLCLWPGQDSWENSESEGSRPDLTWGSGPLSGFHRSQEGNLEPGRLRRKGAIAHVHS